MLKSLFELAVVLLIIEFRNVTCIELVMRATSVLHQPCHVCIIHRIKEKRLLFLHKIVNINEKD